MIAAMVTPPWNIFWWVVGFTVYTVTGGKKWDASGDGAIGMVLFAPVTLPSLPFMWLKERRDLAKLNRKEVRHRQAAEWIAGRLRQRGVNVLMAGGDMFSLQLKAEVPPEKIAAYQETFAEAFRALPETLPEGMFGWGVEPMTHLDRAWAERHGFTDYGEEIFTDPCVDCGRRESQGWRFGREVIAMVADMSRNQRHVVTLADGAAREIDGHICCSCLDRIGWKSMSSGLRPPR